MMTKKLFSNQSGFTLVEMAIVMVLLGLVIASGSQLYKQWIRFDRAVTTQENIDNAVLAITQHRDLYGEYPCPAPLTASRSTPQVGGGATYGIATDCAQTTGAYALGAGVTAAGVARTNSDNITVAHSYADMDNIGGPPLMTIPTIRIGALPFRTMNIEENESFDGYGNRIFYAVTEQLADRRWFDALGGGIEILNDQGVSAIQDPQTPGIDAAHFIIFTAGENGVGAFTREGAQIPCVAGSPESENCDFDVDSTFRVASHGTSGDGTAGQFDDSVTYATHKDIPLWEKGLDPLSPDDMTMKVPGGVGIGPLASQNPTEELQVDGVLRAQDDPNTPANEGELQVNSICDYASGNTTCFASSLIAGDLEATPPTGGMKCPSGQFMVGIKNGQPVCQNEILITCPGNQVMTGLNANGTLRCSGPPPGGCPTVTKNLCNGTTASATATLFAANHNATQTITAGASYTETWRCNNGNWQRQSRGGACTCTPGPVGGTFNGSCSTNSACGAQFTGNTTLQNVVACPSGQTTTTTVSSACTCATTTRTRNPNCPAGFNVGQITETNTNTCGTGGPQCSGWVQTANTCACQPTSTTQNLGCQPWETGTKVQKQDFTCPNGSASPGSWGTPYILTNTCQCTDHTYTAPENCPTGYQGAIMAEYTRTCPNTNYVRTREISNSCAPIPPKVCEWNMPNTNDTSSMPVGKQSGSSCDCATQMGNSGMCYSIAGSNSYNTGACTCTLR